MKQFKLKSASWVAGILALHGAFYPSLSRADAPSCDQTCDDQTNQIAANVSTNCDKYKGKLDASGKPAYDSCKATVEAGYGQVGQYCAAYNQSGKGISWEEASEIVATASAVVCTAMCVLDYSGYGSANKVSWDKVCQIAGAVETAVDVSADIALMIDGGNFMEFAAGTAMAGTAAAGAGTKLLSAGAEKVAGETGKKFVSKLKESCVSAVLLGVLAVQKHSKVKSMEDAQGNACASVQTLYSKQTDLKLATFDATAYKPTAETTTSGTTGSNAAAVKGSGSVPFSERPGADGSGAFPGTLYSAATEGPMGKLLPQDLSRLPSAFHEVSGISLKDLAKKLESGQSPASILAAMSGLPEGFADDFKKMDTLAQAGKISSNLSMPVMTASSSGAKTEAKEDPFAFALGGLGAAKAGGVAEAKFGAAPSRKPASTDGDIWHEKWKGTIFEIVSSKVDQTRDRVDNLEWATPLNRALMGLSNTPKKP